MILLFKPVTIGDCSITPKRGGTLIEMPGECPHKHLIAEEDGEIITCKECKKQVSSFWALMRFARQTSDWQEAIKRRGEAVMESEKKGLTLRAAQKVEQAWRRRKMVPVCPHCRVPILPTDGFGSSLVRRIHAVRAEA